MGMVQKRIDVLSKIDAVMIIAILALNSYSPRFFRKRDLRLQIF
jgi:hypothetical protein